MGESLSNLGVNDLFLLENQLEKSLQRIREMKVAQLLGRSVPALNNCTIPTIIVMLINFVTAE